MNLKDELRHAVGEDITVRDDYSSRKLYSYDQAEVPELFRRQFIGNLPHLIVQPRSAEQVARIFRFAADRQIPIIPRGAASWALGGVLPTRGGIVIDLAPARRVVAVDDENLTVAVEAGTRWADLDHELKKQGLGLCCYPSSWYSTVAGWVATGGYGIGSYKFGHFRNTIVSLQVVLPTGELRTVVASDPDFRHFIGTEGQMGVIWQVTLKVQRRPARYYSHLLQFGNEEAAFAFLGDLAERAITPLTVKFFDRHRVATYNDLLPQRLIHEQPTLLVECDTPEDHERLQALLRERRDPVPAAAFLAEYLWHERFFPLKAKRLGPGLLAAEVLLPQDKVLTFLQQARGWAGDWNARVAIEGYPLGTSDVGRRTSDEKGQANGMVQIIALFLSDPRQKRSYLAHSALVMLLMDLGLDLQGRPYALGLWQSPFVRARYSPQEVADMKAFKARVDPQGICNTGKSFTNSSFLLSGPVAGLGIKLLRLGTRLGLGRLLTGNWRDPEPARSALEESILACSHCGYCVTICPAWLGTDHDERTTARGKLLLGQALLEGDPNISPEEAQQAFLCMHCGGCTEVCQSHLDLEGAWRELEDQLQARFGRPDREIREFVQHVEGSGLMRDRLWYGRTSDVGRRTSDEVRAKADA